ncbi:MAG: BamA/TamA family outer membrane protein [Parvularculaceae bacterium]
MAAQSYEARIENAPEGLKSRLEDASDLIRNGREYPTAASLRRAARRDAAALKGALRAAGYYAAKADFELTAEAEEAKPRVVFLLEPGSLFRVSAYEIVYNDEGDGRPATLSEAKIAMSGDADGAALRTTQEDLLRYLWNNGYPSAEIVSRRAEADFEKAETKAIFIMRSGPRSHFGATSFEGNDKVDEAFLRRRLTWTEGEIFESAKLSAYQQKLFRTGLFANVDVKAGDTVDGATPLTVTVTEAKLRTIGAGVSYSTSDGPGGRVFFEHRNIFGHGEKLHVELTGSEIEQSISATVSRPLPRLNGQTFASAAFTNETTDAYNARSLEVSAGLSKKWKNDHLETRGALALETSNIRANGEEERTYFVSAPMSVIWNSEDDLLDPQKGFRASWTVTPYVGSRNFTQTDLSARGRIHFGKGSRVTLAARTLLSGTIATSFDALPLNKRYYAGGGGSVRGFAYQEAGPLDATGDPIGGRSRFEAAVEARVKTIKNVQLAAFVDAGMVSSSALPDFNDELFIGYGGGIRYLTPIGPIRADIAFPLDKRETDGDFQIYIALGQPF